MFSEEFCEYAASEGFQLDLHPCLKPVVYELNETVVAKLTHGEGLFYLDKGTVGACGAFDARILFQINDVGSCFGEHAVTNMAAELTYRAVTRCEFFVLDKKDLYRLLEKYSEARKEMSEFVFEDLLRHKMLRYWALRMIVPDVLERDERVGSALKLQIAWMRQGILKLQRAHATYGHSYLASLMPGIYGAETIDVDSARASGRGAGRASAGASSTTSVSAVRLPSPAPTAAEAATFQGALASLEASRAALEKKEAAMGQQIGALTRAVEKLLAPPPSKAQPVKA
jgi:hypothetical protein